MKGYVPTPAQTVDRMVDLLFKGRTPTASDSVIDPGSGRGAFVEGIIRWCSARGLPLPKIVCVESDPAHVKVLKEKFGGVDQVKIEERDFLAPEARSFTFAIGNPPYVPITGLDEREKGALRARYVTARGRFDLYQLFFEQTLRSLALGGRMVFITPEKFLYVESACALRKTLDRFRVACISLEPEDTFPGFVTYPTITVVENSGHGSTRFHDRDGKSRDIALPTGGESWLPRLFGSTEASEGRVLADMCLRISCGVATGADSVFVRRVADLRPELLAYSRSTVAGRQITGSQLPDTDKAMLLPYDESGNLLPENRLGALGEYLSQSAVRARLMERTCVKRKPWYAFHETPVLPDILRPKILCKDICESPRFVADLAGAVVPRHSVYYLVPRDPQIIPELLEYLHSPSAVKWLAENAQRAAKGYLRMQSHVLQRLPIQDSVAAGHYPVGYSHNRSRKRSSQSASLPL